MVRLIGIATIFVVVLLSTSFSACNSEPGEILVNFLYDWDEAFSQAGTDNKPIMIDFYTELCPPCKRLDSNTYTDEELSTYLNSSFVCVKINSDKSSLSDTYNIDKVPTIVITSPSGEEIGRFVGYKSADDYQQEIQDIISQWEQ